MTSRTSKGMPRTGRTATLGKPLRVKRNRIVMDPARRELDQQVVSALLRPEVQTIKPFVIVESPFMGKPGVTGNGPGTTAFNLKYARAAIRDCILRGEAPFASHLLYTQEGVLRDEIHEERELGMGLGWHVMRRSNYIVVYTDLGFSSGMIRGVQAAIAAGRPARMRSLKDPAFKNCVPADNKVPVEVIQYLQIEE